VITLALDASTYTGTVVIFRDRDVVAEGQSHMRGAEREELMPTVAAALDEAGVSPRDIQRVVCGAGPGSFTSLRIAASIAKGLALGAGCPLFAAPSLALIPGSRPDLAPGPYLAVLDALRGQAYVAGYSLDANGLVSEILPLRLEPVAEVESLARAAGARAIGAGQPIEAAPHARGVARLEAMLVRDGPVSISTWEPRYGRKAEAQAKWEAAHGRPLQTG
jgi:tRNA threonylcarbamoyladenosine biosynthesis protein TsaB